MSSPYAAFQSNAKSIGTRTVGDMESLLKRVCPLVEEFFSVESFENEYDKGI